MKIEKPYPMNQTSRQTPHRAALNIGVEALRACPGACSGCMVPAYDRSGGLPDIDIRRRMAITGRSMIDAWLADGPPGAADDAAVYFLQGDYLHLPPDDIARAVELAADMTGGHIRALFSTSLVVKTPQLERQLDRFLAESDTHGQEIGFTVIFNPAWIGNKTLRSLYERNIEALRRRLPLDEAGFNIGPGLKTQATPEEMDAFLISAGFTDVDIALLPLRTNAHSFAGEWKDIVLWLRAFFSLSRRHRRYEAIFPALAAEHLRQCRHLEFSEIMAGTARKMAWEIFLDHDGNASPLQTGGFANVVPLSDRFGFSHGLSTGPAGISAARWQERANDTAKLVHLPGLLNETCSSCPFRATCALAGSAIVRSAMKGQSIATENCPLGIRELFEDAAADEVTGQNGRTLFGIPLKAAI